MHWGSAELFVADETGAVKKVRSIRRPPMQERWDREQVVRVTGVSDEPGLGFEDRELPMEGAPQAEIIVIPHPPELPAAPSLR